jgi:hypothetical protein
MTYKGFNPVAFARSAATTLANHIREIEEAFMRNYQIGALLEANGRTNYNNSGEGFDWPVQYRIHNVEGNTGETQRNFARRNLWKQAYLEFRGYQATDSMFYREFLSNRGPEGIVKVYDNFTERLTESMKQALGGEYYRDGALTGYETSWHGLESAFNCAATRGSTNSTITAGTAGATARSANAADLCGYPQGTYAGPMDWLIPSTISGHRWCSTIPPRTPTSLRRPTRGRDKVWRSCATASSPASAT